MGRAMRVFELTAHVKSISRGKGRSATAAAAYRASAVISCEREGRTHDYSRKAGVEASGIALPARAPSWASDRARLWNAAELRERNGKRGRNAGAFKADAVTAREFLFSFPAELSPAGRLRVAEAVARHLVETHGVAADYSIHAPGQDGDQRNHHCHMMTTTRRMTAAGLGEKAREWDDLRDGARLVKAWRAFVADTMNRELAAEEKAGLVHVEHRSFEERGVGQLPTRHQGPGRTNAVRKRQKGARDAWKREARQKQDRRHGEERAALKVRQDFALAAREGELAERERKGVAAIRAELARAQAADAAPTGARRIFQVIAGQAMKADFERQARHAEREQMAGRQIEELKSSLQAERSTYAGMQTKEGQALADRHKAEDRQLAQAEAARVQRDRVEEVQARQAEVRGVGRERGQEREGPGRGMGCGGGDPAP